MPEYLAPGVYVEEVSFRAKSIEGVGTSTTAFAGPTRKGPTEGTPELITSFGDFERVYGGFQNLGIGAGDLAINYLAHSVRSYFNEGGSRLYVSRVYSGQNGKAASADLLPGAKAARFEARFPGEAGNGRVILRQVASPATLKTLDNAPEGSLLRVGGGKAATSALVKGTNSVPFALAPGSVLKLSVKGTPLTITFNADAAQVTGDVIPNPADQIEPQGADANLHVRIGDLDQVIPLPASADLEDMVAAINDRLDAGKASLVGGNQVRISSDLKGKLAAVLVFKNDALGFPNDEASVAAPATHVPNIGQVTGGDVAEVLKGNPNIQASVEDNKLVISTVDTGEDATIEVLGPDVGETSVNAAFGLQVTQPGQPAKGQDGTAVAYYVKVGNKWQDPANALTVLNMGNPGSPLDLLNISLVAEDKDGGLMIYEDMGFDKRHPRFIGDVLAQNPTRRSDALQNAYAINIDDGVDAGELRAGFFPGGVEVNEVALAGGSDGAVPTAADYVAALGRLERLEDISIVAAPGYSAYPSSESIQNELIIHVEKNTRFRIAVLDTPPHRAVSEAREDRARIDSKYAALYYPWVTVANPLARPDVGNISREINLPPSGFICGVYARNDVERGVHKAPANETLRGALRFETEINFAQQQVLNPLGVNCLRYFPGRGFRVWGARTVSSDPEWKYVNVRRYFNYLEASIDRGTQWAVFEPNGDRLWANIRETISSFLYNEWFNGALLGRTTQEAYFVRCDRSTMTQNDLDNGRLVCLVGVAVLKPAEFVIFRIGQKTADARS